MKRIINSPYFDHAVKAVITILVGASLYFIIDVRDFIKFKQPLKDSQQDFEIKNSFNILNAKINMIDSILNYKNRNVHMRIDGLKDVINEANRKLDYLIGIKTYSYENKDN